LFPFKPIVEFGGKTSGPKSVVKGPPPRLVGDERYLMIDQIFVLSRVLIAVKRNEVVALKLGEKGALTESVAMSDEGEILGEMDDEEEDAVGENNW